VVNFEQTSAGLNFFLFFMFVVDMQDMALDVVTIQPGQPPLCENLQTSA